MQGKLRTALEVLMVLAGNVLYAFGVIVFVRPGGLITGGSTGISLFVERMTGIPVSIFAFGLNGLLFLWGWMVLGRKFAATTGLSTLVYPLALEMWQRVLPTGLFTQDMVLCTVFGGLCIGAAIGMTMRVGASTGGMDIPPLIFHHWFNWPIAPLVYLCDMGVLILQAFFTTWDKALYGVLLVLISSVTLNKALLLGQSKVEIKVVSQKVDAIRRAVLSQIDRGGTLIKSRTGFRLEDTEMLMTVLSARELNRTEKLIHQIDPEAFLVVSQVSEVSGRGFSQKKQYLERTEQTPSA